MMIAMFLRSFTCLVAIIGVMVLVFSGVGTDICPAPHVMTSFDAFRVIALVVVPMMVSLAFGYFWGRHDAFNKML